MALVRNAAGALELFARGTDHRLWYRRQVADVPGGWSHWWAFIDTSIRYGPSAVLHRAGRPEVFVVGGNHQLWHLRRTSAGWSRWSSLGGHLIDTPNAAMNPDGRIEVFARAVDETLWHIWQKDHGGWSEWEPLGQHMTYGSPAVTKDPVTGALRLYVTGRDHRIYHSVQTEPGRSGSWDGFRPINLPADRHGQVFSSSQPVVLPRGKGRESVLFTDHRKDVWEIARWRFRLVMLLPQLRRTTMLELTRTAHHIGRPSGGWGIVFPLAGIEDSAGRLHVFATDQRGSFAAFRESAPESGRFLHFPLTSRSVHGMPVAGMNHQGCLEVFVCTSAGMVFHSRQTRVGGDTWSGRAIEGTEWDGAQSASVAEFGRCSLWETGHH